MQTGDVASWQRRWALLNEQLRKEAKATDDETKLTQLDALMASVDAFGWREQLGEEDDRVRGLWMKLRARTPRG